MQLDSMQGSQYKVRMAGHMQIYLFISKRMPSRWHSPWVCCDCSEVAPQQHEDLCKFRLELEGDMQEGPIDL